MVVELLLLRQTIERQRKRDPPAINDICGINLYAFANGLMVYSIFSRVAHFPVTGARSPFI